MSAPDSTAGAENRIYDSASELAFVAQRLRMDLTRPEVVPILAPVLGCLEEALASVAAGLASVTAQLAEDVGPSLEACAAAVEAAARECERTRGAAAATCAHG